MLGLSFLDFSFEHPESNNWRQITGIMNSRKDDISFFPPIVKFPAEFAQIYAINKTEARNLNKYTEVIGQKI
jgi:hypothetical protein